MIQRYQIMKNSKKWIYYKKYRIFIVVLIVILSGIYFVQYTYNKSAGIRFVKNMNVGWNLGNSLDADGKKIKNGDPEIYEVSWGNPVTTKVIIDEIKDGGFNTVRIPVTWYHHMDEKGVIDQKWMNRVQEVVDYVIENDMYAIVDIHHDKWFVPSYDNQENAKKMLSSTWSQIAERFANYDDHLIFEAMNEPRLIGTEFEWNAGNKEVREVVNNLNETFVETIRSGSNENKKRYLMVAPYCNSSDIEALDDFVLPKDERIILSIHEYIPYEFTMKEDVEKIWSKDNSDDTKEIDNTFNNLYNKFISKGIPVIISEFGAANKNNLKERLEWAKYYVTAAREKNIMCIWWDDGSNEEKKGKYELFDRYNLKWEYPEIVYILVRKSDK
ncbi:glycoside hydrolase family 5 protein [Clostridium lacusfryxellense]|uniref:glycoside hydrolase family 5 protein n=1 Tax=Clostridium lacusfryxellense TaxID=205328 RepID=UPI001C0C3E02|nr:glycoside hydrolase family 5 protein [Clostridium lacusfryxellense]MBU3114096.1 glycoside hydrolase family 5 protein [Clostridium lacusfryxellense]